MEEGQINPYLLRVPANQFTFIKLLLGEGCTWKEARERYNALGGPLAEPICEARFAINGLQRLVGKLGLIDEDTFVAIRCGPRRWFGFRRQEDGYILIDFVERVTWSDPVMESLILTRLGHLSWCTFWAYFYDVQNKKCKFE